MSYTKKQCFAACMAALTFWATGLIEGKNGFSAGPRSANAQTQMRAAGQDMAKRVPVPDPRIHRVLPKNFTDPRGFSVFIFGKDRASGVPFQGTYSQHSVSGPRVHAGLSPVQASLFIQYNNGITQTFTATFVPGADTPYGPVARTNAPGANVLEERGEYEDTVKTLGDLCAAAATGAVPFMKKVRGGFFRQHKAPVFRR